MVSTPDPIPHAPESAGDVLYDASVVLVDEAGKCSTSYIQRRLQIRYNEAVSLVERMEREGLVTPPDSAGARRLTTAEERSRRAILAALADQAPAPSGDEPVEVPITRAQAAILVDIGRMAAEACGLAYGPSGDEVAELRAENDRLRAENEQLRDGLKPFAVMWQKDLAAPFEGLHSEEHGSIELSISVRIGALAMARKLVARAALSQHQKGE